MSVEKVFSKNNIEKYLENLSKEFRKLNGNKASAELILIGGAEILLKYNFRKSTDDVDAIILSSSAMKDAVNIVGDRYGLPNGWLNMDFKNTKSYSTKLLEVSKYYKTFSNVLQVRIVEAEYLIAMKLMSGRSYKNDLSDISGILWEHRKHGKEIKKAAIYLYEDWNNIPEGSRDLIEKIFNNGDYENKEYETKTKKILIEFNEKYPSKINVDNVDDILEKIRNKENEQTQKKPDA